LIDWRAGHEGNPNRFGEEDDAAEKIHHGRLGFSLVKEGPLLISYP
jgi:hypothetical protein